MPLQTDKKQKIPQYWVDGFLPEMVKDTRTGIKTEGKVWIFEGSEPEVPYNFKAIVSQNLLNMKIRIQKDRIISKKNNTSNSSSSHTLKT